MTVELAHDVRGSGPPLLLIHGITENRFFFDPLLDDLAADHRVLRVDLRGHGDSPDGPDYDIANMAADIAPLTDEPPLVIGHSLGGIVATAYAAAFPVRGVINIDQNLDLAGMQAQVQSLAPVLRGDQFPALMTGMFDQIRGQVPDGEWTRMVGLRRLDQAVVLGVWSLMLDHDAAHVEAAVRDLTATVGAPYLALDGSDPGPDHLEWLRQRIPQAQLEVWDGVGHYPHLVRPEQFLLRVKSFEQELSG